MTFRSGASYLQTLQDAFTETSHAFASAELNRLFTDDNGECTVIFLSACAEAVRDGRKDVIAHCLSRIDVVKKKIDCYFNDGESGCEVRPSSMAEASLRAALAAIELKGGESGMAASWDEIRHSFAALRGSESGLRDLGSEVILQKKDDEREMLEALFRTAAQEPGCDSTDSRIWLGWPFRLISFFIEDGRRSEITCSVSVPLYYPGTGGEICTLVVERLPYGTGAIYPHPVYSNPCVIWKNTEDSMNTVNHLIRDYLRGSGIGDGKCDIIWHLKSETTGKSVRALRGTSCGAGLAMALSSLLDSSVTTHSLCVTGSVSAEGLILPVRAMRAKLEAVKRWSRSHGRRVNFIIPGGNSCEPGVSSETSVSGIIRVVSSVEELLALRHSA
jgi:hypothetical protein